MEVLALGAGVKVCALITTRLSLFVLDHPKCHEKSGLALAVVACHGPVPWVSIMDSATLGRSQ
jgi:hypothetical protein